jgi:hypothetical protein
MMWACACKARAREKIKIAHSNLGKEGNVPEGIFVAALFSPLVLFRTAHILIAGFRCSPSATSWPCPTRLLGELKRAKIEDLIPPLF